MNSMYYMHINVISAARNNNITKKKLFSCTYEKKKKKLLHAKILKIYSLEKKYTKEKKY